jgi:hypothetical protein
MEIEAASFSEINFYQTLFNPEDGGSIFVHIVGNAFP